MEITSQTVGTIHHIEMTGRLDLIGAEVVENYFREFLGKVSVPGDLLLVVDFHKVDYISSGGLRALVTLFKKVNESGGKMALASMNIAVEEVFQFAGLDTVFQIFPTVEEATRALVN
jgi:anti-sigma B factor antagonist